MSLSLVPFRICTAEEASVSLVPFKGLSVSCQCLEILQQSDSSASSANSGVVWGGEGGSQSLQV